MIQIDTNQSYVKNFQWTLIKMNSRLTDLSISHPDLKL